MRLRLSLSRQNVLTGLMLAAAVSALVGRGWAYRAREAVHFVLAPMGDGGMYVVTVLRERAGDLGRRGLSGEQVKRMEEQHDQEVFELRNEAEYWRYMATVYRKQARDATQFRGYYAPSNGLPCELVPARVTAADSMAYGHTRLLSKPSDARTPAGSLVTTRQIVHDRSKALPPGVAIINAQSLVGELIEPSGAFTAELRLVTDPAFSAPAHILRKVDPNHPRMIQQLEGDAAVVPLTRQNNQPVKATIYGTGDDEMVLRDVSAEHNVLPGDNVVTYPDGRFAFIPIFIGKVTRVVSDPENRRFQTVYVKPHADLSTLRDVFVVVPIMAEAPERP